MPWDPEDRPRMMVLATENSAVNIPITYSARPPALFHRTHCLLSAGLPVEPGLAAQPLSAAVPSDLPAAASKRCCRSSCPWTIGSLPCTFVARWDCPILRATAQRNRRKPVPCHIVWPRLRESLCPFRCNCVAAAVAKHPFAEHTNLAAIETRHHVVFVVVREFGGKMLGGREVRGFIDDVPHS